MADELDGCFSFLLFAYCLGLVIAVVISWSMNHAIGWAALHGVLSWIYVIYYAVQLRQ